ncbi:MAG: DUF1828 domain-containing protein [Oscillospiraceae bacterium]|nr:DUF1828 domain-containing protein [Oscillospiraceae bacterium]
MKLQSNNNYIDKYLSWLKDNTASRKISQTVEVITAPFLDRHNDYVQLYVESNGDSLRVSDDGYTVSDLEMNGIDVLSGSRYEYLQNTLRGFGTKLGNGNELYIETSEREFAQSKHALIQSMLAVNDLYVIGREHISSLFLEDCRSFLNEADISYVPDLFIAGKSGYQHKYDFVIAKNRTRPERFIKAVNTLNRTATDNLLLAWNETLPVRPNAKLYAMINDKNPIRQKEIDALKNYDVVPIKFGEREWYVDQLAS